jgi:hypothetical protein
MLQILVDEAHTSCYDQIYVSAEHIDLLIKEHHPCAQWCATLLLFQHLRQPTKPPTAIGGFLRPYNFDSRVTLTHCPTQCVL